MEYHAIYVFDMRFPRLYNGGARRMRMNFEEYRALTARGEYLTAGSAVHRFMVAAAEDARRITCEINNVFHTDDELRALFSRLIGEEIDGDFRLFPPFYTDFGRNIRLGRRVFINSGCCFQDQGGIFIGDDCLIGHQVVIATLNHDLAPAHRGSMRPSPVRIGNNVWIGAHATLLPGVNVGNNSVIAAGAVVSRDVPANTVVAGVPAKIIRTIGGKEE